MDLPYAKWGLQLKRILIVIFFFFIEQFIFLLNPHQINYIKLLPTESQSNIHKNLPFLENSFFTASFKIGLSIMLMGVLIWTISKIIKKQEININYENSTLDKLSKSDTKAEIITKIAIYSGLTLGLQIAIGIIKTVFHLTTSTANQTNLNNMSNQPASALWMILIGGIFIPIFEELIFRRLIIDYITPKHYRMYGAVISIIVFALLHVLGSKNPGIDIFSYLIPASMFTLVYYKTSKIRYSISVHIINNLISLSPLILIIFNYIMSHKDDIINRAIQHAWPGK